MRKLFILGAIVALAAIAMMMQQQTPTADAVTGTLAVTGISDDNGDCTQLTVTISITDRFANNNDDGTFDYYYAVVYGGETAHASRKLRAPFGSTATITGLTIDELFYGPLANRPLRIVLYDVVAPGELSLETLAGSPFFAETYIDPAQTLASCAPLEVFDVNDERVNRLTDEPWQTAAIYCRDDGGFDVYYVQDGVNGQLAFSITEDIIASVGVQAENAVLASSFDGNVVAFRLNTGEFQVNASTAVDFLGYAFLWDGCGAQ